MKRMSFAQAVKEANIKGKKVSKQRGLNYFSITGNAMKKGSLKLQDGQHGNEKNK
jgi:hypothetical protein